MMAIVMFALSLIVYEIFANKDKFQKFDLENEDQGQEVHKLDLHLSIRNARILLGEFF